ncbi:MAG: hypothetical protein O3B72_04480 [Proteobacteria bacterium]|nr:hypothetical protein [Pseudomonadota bacterium]
MIDITLQAPFGQIREDRDKDKEYPAQLKFEGQTFNLEVEVRGNKRLQSMTCKNPPLWLDFDNEQIDDTYFENQKKTKLVVLCRKGGVNYDYLRAEYLVYKLYEQIAPVYFKTRWVNATYIEEDGSTRTEPAFFIERKQRMAKRVGMDLVDLQSIDYQDLDLDVAAVLGLFNYVVANPDFSLVSAMSGSCCHNAKLLKNAAGKYVPVLYDFDSAGVVDARYAVPNPALPIKKVTQRLYRGYCIHNDNLPAARQQMIAAEQDFYRLINDDPVLSNRYKKKMVRYLERSFAWITRDADFESRILNECRGDLT